MKKILCICLVLLVATFLLVACGEKEQEHVHSFGEWDVTKNPTCTEDGTKVRYCDCGEKQSEVVLALGHTPEDVVIENIVDTTCETDGSYDEVVYCSVDNCKAQISRTTKVVGAIGHNFVDGICNICGESDPDYIPDATYSEGLEYTSNGDGTCYVSGIGTCTDTDIVIPAVSPTGDRVTGVGSYAFNNRCSFSSVVIGNNVTYIGYAAFYGCSSLVSVVIPNSVTSIGFYAFYGCSSLTFVVIPESIISIDGLAFSNCPNLMFNEYEGIKYLGNENNPYFVLVELNNDNLFTYTIHPDTKIISGTTFFNCQLLTSIVIPDGVVYIGNSAFSRCSRLGSIVIPNTVTSIGDGAFNECSLLTDVYYTGTETEWVKIFVGSSGNEYLYSAEVFYYSETQPTTEGNFWHWVDGMPTVWDAYVAPEAPAYSVGLEYTSNGDGTCYVSGIGTCKDVIVVIPEISPEGWKVVAINSDDSFDYNTTSIFISSSIDKIEGWLIKGAEELKEIIVDENNQYFKSVDGHLFTKDGTKLIKYASANGSDEYDIPYGVITIESLAFYSMRYNIIKRISLPDTVTTIEGAAFIYCANMIEITIPKNVKTIGSGAFQMCLSLDRIYYKGTPSEWNAIIDSSNNNDLQNTTIYFYSETAPTTEGNFWHYVDGMPTIW